MKLIQVLENKSRGCSCHARHEEKNGKSVRPSRLVNLLFGKHDNLVFKIQVKSHRETTRTNIHSLSVSDFEKIRKKKLEPLNKLFNKYSKSKLGRIKHVWKDSMKKDIDQKMAEIPGFDADFDSTRLHPCVDYLLAAPSMRWLDSKIRGGYSK